MKRTTIELDEDLLAAARAALGTAGIRSTVEAALRAVVTAHGGRRHLEWLATEDHDLADDATMADAWS